jgi:hypothetical protein
LKDLILGQAKINESLSKKLAANDKTLESITIKIETLSSALKNQLSFNKMFETQLAQVAAAVPFTKMVNAVTTRGGKSNHDPPYPNHVERDEGSPDEAEPSAQEGTKKPGKKRLPKSSLISASSHFPLATGRPPWTSNLLVLLR